MNEIDLIFIIKLFYNSHLTYRELAEVTGMSVSATHKQIRKFVDDGIISAFIARSIVMRLRFLWIMISGSSNAKSVFSFNFKRRY